MDRELPYVCVGWGSDGETTLPWFSQTCNSLLPPGCRYDQCLQDLKVTQKRIAEEEAADRARQKGFGAAAPVVAIKPSAKSQRIAQLVGNGAAVAVPKRSEGYGMVPAHLRQDKRSLEEVERDMRAKRARKAEAADTEEVETVTKS